MYTHAHRAVQVVVDKYEVVYIRIDDICALLPPFCSETSNIFFGNLWQKPDELPKISRASRAPGEEASCADGNREDLGLMKDSAAMTCRIKPLFSSHAQWAIRRYGTASLPVHPIGNYRCRRGKSFLRNSHALCNQDDYGCSCWAKSNSLSCLESLQLHCSPLPLVSAVNNTFPAYIHPPFGVSTHE